MLEILWLLMLIGISSEKPNILLIFADDIGYERRTFRYQGGELLPPCLPCFSTSSSAVMTCFARKSQPAAL